jgi:hypothetical protein
MRAALVCLSCFVAWGFGFCRTGLWARPRPGALGGALVNNDVMPRKIWSGPVRPVLPPPKFPGVAMESCLMPNNVITNNIAYRIKHKAAQPNHKPPPSTPHMASPRHPRRQLVVSW